MRHLRSAVLVACFTVLGASPTVRAENGSSSKTDSLKSWFSHWKNALQKSAVENRYKRGARTTAVAAVRGSGQAGEDALKPYWKGSRSSKQTAERDAERAELAKAVDLILSGKLDDAEKAFAAFEAAHPASSLLADMKEAKGKLAELKSAGNP